MTSGLHELIELFTLTKGWLLDAHGNNHDTG